MRYAYRSGSSIINMIEKEVILIAEPERYSEKAVAQYRRVGSVYFWFRILKRQREHVLPNVTILVVRLALNVNAALMDRMPQLRVIATSTTGLNHIDTTEAKKRGIYIISLRGRTSFLKRVPSTAEETMGLILALMRHIPWAFDDVKRGNWRSTYWRGYQLKGKTLGIIGLGRLGKIVARYARMFGMQVLAVDPSVSAVAMKRSMVTKVSLPTFLRRADVVSLHVPFNERTRHLIAARHLKMMKQTAYLINTARAELIDKDALLQALRESWIAGAALDVWWKEKDDASHLKNDSLIRYAKKHTNLLVVPHIGGATEEAMEATQEFLAGLVVKYITDCKKFS